MTKATYFQHITDFTDLRVHPPFEPKDKTLPWVNGYIRNADGSDFVVTGPALRVCFTGCRWDKMVLAMPGIADERAYEFERWLGLLTQYVENQIWQNPERFKPGCKSNSRFTFDHDIIKPSADPAAYPDQLVCQLSTRRKTGTGYDEDGAAITTTHRFVDADLFCVEDSMRREMTPEEVLAGSVVVPMFKFSYFRNIDRFGLRVTLIRGHIAPPEIKPRVDNKDYEFDYAMDVSV